MDNSLPMTLTVCTRQLNKEGIGSPFSVRKITLSRLLTVNKLSWAQQGFGYPCACRRWGNRRFFFPWWWVDPARSLSLNRTGLRRVITLLSASESKNAKMSQYSVDIMVITSWLRSVLSWHKVFLAFSLPQSIKSIIGLEKWEAG